MKKLIMWLVALVVVCVGFAQARVLLVPGTASWYADRYYNNSYGYYDDRYCTSYDNCNYDYLYRDTYQYRYDRAQTYMPRITKYTDHDYRYRDDRYYYRDNKYRYDDDDYSYRYNDYDNYRYDYHDYDDDYKHSYRYRDDTTPLLSNIPTYVPYTHDNAYYQTTPDKTKVVRLDYYYDRYGNPYILKYDY